MSICYQKQWLTSNDEEHQQPRKSIKLLSYNAQVGISCSKYQDYLIQSWRHVLPDSSRQNHLREISNYLSNYDVVALQEVDSGSLRTQYFDQVSYLAQSAGFPYWYHQTTRNLGKFAAHSNALLTKFPASQIVKHKLPGKISARGALQACFGEQDKQLVVLSIHLSLRPGTRRKQLAYISQLVKEYSYFVIMGDMNCSGPQVKTEWNRHGLSVKSDARLGATFPSWKPKHHFDQIWISSNLNIIKSEVLNFGVSDHLPVSIEIELPEKIRSCKGLANESHKSLDH